MYGANLQKLELTDIQDPRPIILNFQDKPIIPKFLISSGAPSLALVNICIVLQTVSVSMPTIVDLTMSDSPDPLVDDKSKTIGLHVHDDSIFEPEKASLIGIPAETRFQIYDYLVKIKGTLTLFARYEITKEVDTQTVKLMHVNRLLRSEVQDFFYKNQNFQFRSTPAINNFLERIGRYHASIIKNIEMTEFMSQRLSGEQMTNLLQWLPGLERLTLINPRTGYLYVDEQHTYQTGEKTDILLCASEKLAAGRIFVDKPAPCAYSSLLKMLFVPAHVEYSTVVPHVCRNLYAHLPGGVVYRIGHNPDCLRTFTEIVLHDKLILEKAKASTAKDIENNSSTSLVYGEPSDEVEGVKPSGEIRNKRKLVSDEITPRGVRACRKG